MSTSLATWVDAQPILGLVGALVVVGCGARTGLFAEGIDGGPDDAAPLLLGDDAIPPFTMTPNTMTSDAARECSEEVRGRIFVVTSTGVLHSFDTATAHFDRIGRIDCVRGAFSMAVDRFGTAFVLNSDGSMVEVDTRTAGCRPTAYRPRQHAFGLFGMAFAGDGGSAERLFVVGDDSEGSPSALATIDTKTFTLDVIHTYNPSLGRTELTGTSDERLFGYVAGTDQLRQLDKAMGAVLSSQTVPNVGSARSFAFAWSDGQFYLFTDEIATGRVTKFDPVVGVGRLVARLDTPIVGAGVSTCSLR